MNSEVVIEETYMRNKILSAVLILSCLLVIISLVACSGKQSANTSGTTKNSQSMGTPPNGQILPGTSGIAPGANILPSGTPAGNSNNSDKNNIAQNQTVIVVGSGTVAINNYANLYFGSAGRIASISVKQGDRVTKGTILTQLDTGSLKAAVYQAQVSLDQAKLAQAQCKLALTQAKSSVATAQYNLDKTNAVSDIKDAITDDRLAVKAIEVNMKQALATGDSAAVTAYNQNMSTYQNDLTALQKKLNTLLSQAPYTAADQAVYINGQKYDRLTVEDVQIKQLAVESAELSVNYAQLNLDNSQDAITLTQANLDLARQQLDQATITAPFDGLAANVNQNVGDYVASPSQLQNPIIYLIDSNSMEIKININELDIPSVKVGMKATVNLNAFPNKKLDGQITTISPVSTVQGGVVNYMVTITFSVPAGMDVRVGMKGSASISTS
jgi:HlyD family secretion protein